jgi:hypothetical protein
MKRTLKMTSGIKNTEDHLEEKKRKRSTVPTNIAMPNYTVDPTRFASGDTGDRRRIGPELSCASPFSLSPFIVSLITELPLRFPRCLDTWLK